MQHTYSEKINVHGWHDDIKPIEGVQIANVWVAYDDPIECVTYLLNFDQVLLVPGVQANLLCVDQLRANSVIVNDTPLIRLPPHERTRDKHSIIADGVAIPLSFVKPISYFNCRKPTNDESLEDITYRHVSMTGSIPWEPYDDATTRHEEQLRAQLTDHQAHDPNRGIYALRHETSRSIRINKMLSTHESTPCSFADIDKLAEALGDNCHVETKIRSISIRAVSSSGKSYLVTPDMLARRFKISLETAKRTLDATTQRAVRDWSVVKGARRFRPVQFQLEYPRIKLPVYVDIKFGPCKSVEGNTCLAIYATAVQWARGYPLKNERDVHTTLSKLFRQFGFPSALIPDDAQSLTQGEFKKTANKGQVPIMPIEPHNPNQNLAEDTIREASRMYTLFMNARGIPLGFWDRVFLWCLEVRSHIAHGHPMQEGQCGATLVRGDTADISHLVDFCIYDWCWALSPRTSNQPEKQLCRWLGPSFDYGASLCFAVVNANGQILHRSSVVPLNAEERNSEDIKQRKDQFTKDLNQRLRDKAEGISISREDQLRIAAKYSIELKGLDDEYPEFEPYEDDNAADKADEVAPVAEEQDPVEFDKYISAKLAFNRDDPDNFGVIKEFGKVKGRKRNSEGKFIGQWHSNPHLDTSIYEVEFEDGRVEPYLANQIAEAMLMNTDDQGNTLLHVKEIIAHKKDGRALHPDDGFYISKNGQKRHCKTTKG